MNKIDSLHQPQLGERKVSDNIPSGIAQAINYLTSCGIVNEIDGEPFDANTPYDEIIEAYDPVLKGGFKASFGTVSLEKFTELPYEINKVGEMVSYKDWVEDHYKVTLVVVGNELAAKGNDGTMYIVNEDGSLEKLPNGTVLVDYVSLFKQQFQGTTVGNALLATLNNPEFRETALDCGATDKQIVSFMQEISIIIQNPMREKIFELMWDENYTGIFVALLETNEELYSIIFENC